MARRLLIGLAAKELGVSEHFLRTEIRAGRIPYISAGNRYIVDPEQVDQVLRNRALDNMVNNSQDTTKLKAII